MAVYFTKGSNPYSSVGAALGTGLTKGLDALAKDKIHNMLQQKKEAHLSKLLQAVNYNEPTANILANLAHLNPNHFHDYLEMVGSGGQQQPVGGQQEQLGQQFAAPEQNFIQPNMNQQNMGEQNNQMAPVVQQQSTSLQRQQQEATPLFANKRKENLVLQEALEDKKALAEQQKEIRKEVLPFVKDVRSKARGAEENDLRLDRMEALINTGKVDTPLFATLIKTITHGVFGVGLDLTSVLSPESQQFEKLSTDFLKNAKDLFGSRITDQEVQNFLKTIPSLTQSNSGKIAVIENLKDFNEAAKVKRDITNELLKKYGSNLPANFEDQVEELARPSLDALAEKFKKVADINPAAYAGYSFPGSGFFR